MELIRHIPPVFVICVGAILACGAIVAYRSQRPGLAFGFILAFGITLRLYASSDAFLHLWDESFHAVVAKNCMTNPLRPTLYLNPALAYDYRDWLANQVWLHKPPLALWLIAGSLRVFGIHEFAVRIPSLIASSLLIYLVYVIGMGLWSRSHGLLASALCAVNHYLINLAAGREATDHVDTLLITLVAAGAFFVLRAERSKRPMAHDALVGLSVGLAYLTKGMPGLLALGLWAVAVLADPARRTLRQELARFLLIVAVALLVAAPWTLYAHATFPLESAWESGYSLRHLFEALEGHSHPWHFYIARLNKWLGPVGYAALCWTLFRLLKRDGDRGLLLVFAWFAVPHGVFSLSATKMPAYTLIGAGAGFLLISVFILDMKNAIAAQWPSHSWQRVVLFSLLLLSLCIPLKRTLKNLHLIREYERAPKWARQLRHLAAKHSDPNTVVFAVPHAIEAMFYGEYSAYNFLPSRNEIEAVIATGRAVVVYDHGRLPRWVHEVEGIQLHTPLLEAAPTSQP